MKYLNSPILTLTALTAFLVLASWVYSHPPTEHGYTAKETAAMAALVEREIDPRRNALMDVWQLTEADVAAPVKIWGEK